MESSNSRRKRKENNHDRLNEMHVMERCACFCLCVCVGKFYQWNVCHVIISNKYAERINWCNNICLFFFDSRFSLCGILVQCRKKKIIDRILFIVFFLYDFSLCFHIVVVESQIFIDFISLFFSSMFFVCLFVSKRTLNVFSLRKWYENCLVNWNIWVPRVRRKIK